MAIPLLPDLSEYSKCSKSTIPDYEEFSNRVFTNTRLGKYFISRTFSRVKRVRTIHQVVVKAKLDKIYSFYADIVSVYNIAVYATENGQWAIWVDNAQKNLNLNFDYEWHTWSFVELEDANVKLRLDEKDITIVKGCAGILFPIRLGGLGCRTRFESITIDGEVERFDSIRFGPSGERWQKRGTGRVTVSDGLLVCDPLVKAGTAYAHCNHHYYRRTLDITTIATCPVNCAKYCPQDVLKKSYHGYTFLSLSNFMKALSHVPKDVHICFAGYGEPLLNPSVKDMILHAHNEGYALALFTTLSNIKSETFEAIKHIPFTMVCVHLPDVDGITNVKITDDYLAVLESLKQMPRVIFMSMGEIPPAVRRILPNYSYQFVSNERAGNCQGVNPKKKFGKLYCSKLKYSQFVMLPDCTVTLCCNDYGMRHRLGNLLTDSYDGLMDSDEMRRILKSVNSISDGYALCRTCKAADSTPIFSFLRYPGTLMQELTTKKLF